MINTFLLAGDKFMSKMWTAYQKKEIIQKFKETHDSIYTYQKDLDNACFQHDVVYGDFKDLPRITASDKVLHDRAFNIAKNPKYDGYQRGLASIVYELVYNGL